jgi:hypothetical protein
MRRVDDDVEKGMQACSSIGDLNKRWELDMGVAPSDRGHTDVGKRLVPPPSHVLQITDEYMAIPLTAGYAG